MNNVRFGKYHSFDDFSLILISKTIESPQPKTEYVEVPGADGQVDLTEYFGDIKYSNRMLTFEFETKLRNQDFYDMFEKISNAINGKRLNIYLDESPYFYYVGRISLNEYTSKEKIGKIVIEANCDPYRLEYIECYHQYDLEGELEVNLVNLKKRATPTIIVEGTDENGVNIQFEDYSKKVSNGTFVWTELELKEGYNYLTLVGNGKITFKYQRGKL